VHVWRIPLTGAMPLASSLAPDEHARASALVRPGDGARWAASRVALRGILASYLGVDPNGLTFERSLGGKPWVRGAPELHYNLTHSFDLAICAVGAIELGVDVEKIRTAPLAAGVAAGIVSPAGPIRPDEGASAELDWVFFTSRTRVEAALKASGEGLSAIDRRAPEWIRGLASPGLIDLDGRPLRILDLPVDDEYAAALAILGEDVPTQRIRCWTWGNPPFSQPTMDST